MSATIPERIRLAVALMHVPPQRATLEIGCGTGIALAKICEKLTDGRVVGLDRSAVAIAGARKRLAAHLAADRAFLQQVELARARLDPGSFDLVFAINVNCFWTREAAPELEIVRRCLTPTGKFWLFYESPSKGGAQLSKINTAVTAQLSIHGFGAVTSEVAVSSTCRLLALRGCIGLAHQRGSA